MKSNAMANLLNKGSALINVLTSCFSLFIELILLKGCMTLKVRNDFRLVVPTIKSAKLYTYKCKYSKYYPETMVTESIIFHPSLRYECGFNISPIAIILKNASIAKQKVITVCI